MNDIFKTLASLLKRGDDICLVVRKNTPAEITVSVAYRNNNLSDTAKNYIQPLVLTGTPEEMDEGFAQAVKAPLQSAEGLLTTMSDYEAAQEVAKANSAAAKKAADDEKNRKDKLKKMLAEADKARAAKKWPEATALYKKAQLVANEKEGAAIAKSIELCSSQNVPDVFASMDDELPGGGDNAIGCDEGEEDY